MKLNKKGYMLVELILSTALAMSIAYYLLNLTYKFKDTREDIYQSTSYNTEKIVITKNIMDDLIDKQISNITVASSASTNQVINLKVKNSASVEEYRKLMITKSGGTTTIKYGKTNSSYSTYSTSDVSYYEKTISSSLQAGKVEVIYKNNLLEIKIPLESLYTTDKYDIKLLLEKDV